MDDSQPTGLYRSSRVLVTLNGLRGLAAAMVVMFHTQTYHRDLPPDGLIFGGWSFGFAGAEQRHL